MNNLSKTSNAWKANLNTAFEEADMEDDEGDMEDRRRDYYHEGTADNDDEEDDEENEEDDEENESYEHHRYDDEDYEYHLPTVPSIESFIAKQTVDSVIENVLSPHR